MKSGAPDAAGRGRWTLAARVVARSCDRRAGGWLATALLLVTLSGLTAALAPVALARLVDGLGRPHPSGRLAPLAAYVAALLVQRLLEQAQAFAYGRGEQRLVRRLAANAFEHMLRLPLRDHLDARSGEMAQVLADGGQGLRMILLHLVLTLAPVVVQLAVAGAVVVGVFDRATAVLLVVALVGYAAVFATGVARQAAPARGISVAQSAAAGVAADGLMNVEALKVLGAEAAFADRYDGALAARERQWADLLGGRMVSGLLVAGVFGAALTAALYIGEAQVGRHQVSAGAFVLLNAYVLQLVRPLELLGFAARDVGQGLAYLDALLEVIGRAPERSAPGDGVSPPGPASLRFEGVSASLGGGRPTIRDLSFDIAPGSLTAVVGPSGAGKSALLRLILRLYEPDAGQILWDGAPAAREPLALLRRQIAVVSQDTILFNDTIAGNIAVAAPQASCAQLLAAARAASLSDLLGRLPEGLATRVGERGLKLSGGERQRVAIARAAVKSARLLLLDEATAALDAPTEQAVWEALVGLGRGLTRVIVTHRLSTIIGADQILVLDAGRLVERGRHEELLAANQLYARLWRAQTRPQA